MTEIKSLFNIYSYNIDMRIYKPKIFKNGAIGAYVKSKKGKLVWRIVSGPKHQGGAYGYDDINKSLASNISFLNLADLILFFTEKRYD